MAASPIVLFNAGQKWLIWPWRYRLIGCVVNLYINDHVPAPGDTLSDYAPATFPGYQPWRFAEWSYPYTNANGNAEIAGPMMLWTQTGVPSPLQTVYGYYVQNPNADLLYAQRTEDVGFVLVSAPLPYQVQALIDLGRLS